MLTPTPILIFSTVVACCAGPAKLPSYITPCSRNSNQFRDCSTKEAIKSLPQILDGNKPLKIPNFKPFKLTEVKIDAGNNLKIKLSDITITGFENHDVHDVDIDLKQHHIRIKIGFPVLTLISTYDIEGRILVLPIRGHGPANITFVGGEYEFNADFDFVKRDRIEYLKLKESKLDYVTKRTYYRLDNLFDGDSTLGEEMNKFLDENWQDVSTDLGPAIGEVIAVVATSLANGYFDTVSYDDLFPK